MTKLRWSPTLEGSAVLVAVSLGLLGYGLAHEEMLSLGGAVLPGAALLLLLVLAAVDLAISSRTPADIEPGEQPIAVVEIVGTLAVCIIYCAGIITLGPIATTSLFLVIIIAYVDGKITLYNSFIALVMAVVVWAIFVPLGGTYFPSVWMF